MLRWDLHCTKASYWAKQDPVVQILTTLPAELWDSFSVIQFFTRSPKCLKHVRAYVEKADVMDSCHQMPDAALHVFTPSVLWEHLLVQARLDLAAELHCWHVRPRLPPPPPPLPRTVTKVLLNDDRDRNAASTWWLTEGDPAARLVVLAFEFVRNQADANACLL